MQTQKDQKWRTGFGRAALVCLVVISAVLIWTRIITQDRPATITQVYGTVLVSPARETGWITARPGQQLQRGDQLFTESPDSGVVVVFNDQHIAFRLEADSLVTVTARWNSLTKSGSAGLSLSHGILKAETQDGAPAKKTRFSIDTPLARADVHGTRLIVQVLKAEQTTRISALEGEVWVRAKPEHALLYPAGSAPLASHETVISENETLIVYAEPAALEALRANQHLGRVVNHANRKGVAGVVVQVLGDPARFAETDETGYFEIPGPTLNTELILAGTTSDVPGDLELVSQVGQVKGQVIDIFDSESLPDVEVVPIRHPSLATRTSTDGTFTIEELPVGSHTLILKAEGYVSAVAEVTVDQAAHVTIDQILLVSYNQIFNYLPIIMRNFPQYP